ncbi:MAG: EAL domain-containing protein [Nitrospirae bacterium]|nr:EAL domain-containing protein [Nitrospirota bacterium]
MRDKGKKSEGASKVNVSINENFYYNKKLSLPTVIKEYDNIERILLETGYLSCITIQIEDLRKVEQLYGSNIYLETFNLINAKIKELREILLRKADIFIIDIYDVDTFVIFLSSPRDDNTKLLYHLEEITERIRIKLEHDVFTFLYPYLKEISRPTIGHALEIQNPMINNMRLIMQLINGAKKMGQFMSLKYDYTGRYALQRIIVEERISTVFQPIVNLKTLDILGYEALSRGPENTEFYNPLLLFLLSAKCGLSFELDSLCRKKALESARHLDTDKKIFINTLSMTIHDPEFRGAYLKGLLNDLKLKPENVVFEVSEKLAIDNYALFREAMSDYTDLGIVHAGDDIGSGYSGLERIMELNPGFLKIDMSFSRNIGRSFIKQEIVRAIVNLSEKIGSLIIAEGIETKEEYETLRDIGVIYGQGYLFARPSEELGDIQKDFV